MMKQGKAFKDGGKFSRVFSVRMRWYIWRLKSKNSDVRRAAAEALGKIGSKEAVPHLAKALKDEDHIVRIEAVEALGKIGWQPQSQEERILYLIAIRAWDKLVKIGPSTVPYLAKALKYEDVGKEAADALVKIGSKEAVPYLIKEVLESIPCLIEDVLGSKDWGHNYKARETAAWVLVKIGSKEAISYLVKVLKHDYRDMRRVAAEVLGEIGSKEAVPHLIEALNDKDSYVRQAAAKALGEIGSKKAIPHLIEVLKDKYIDVRIAAAEALRKIKRQSQNHEEKF